MAIGLQPTAHLSSVCRINFGIRLVVTKNSAGQFKLALPVQFADIVQDRFKISVHSKFNFLREIVLPMAV